MIYMVREGDPGRVHMVPKMLLSAKTLCTFYAVEADNLHETGELPTCMGCIIARLHEVIDTWLGRGIQDDEAFEFGQRFRRLLMETDADIEAEWQPEVDSPLGPGVLASLKEAQVLLEVIEEDKYVGREELTMLCLQYSLCPLHRRDYAVCFDDDNQQCSFIRLIHPVHDS